MACHGAQQIPRPIHILVVVTQGFSDRVLHETESGKVQNRNGAMGGHRVVERNGIENVAFLQRAPTNEISMSCRQIVEDNGAKTCPCQRFAGVASNIPRATRNKNCLRQALSSRLEAPAL